MAGRRVAILIASSIFPEEPGLDDLRFPENDVDGLEEAITSEVHGEFRFTDTFFFKNLPRHEILPQIEEILRSVDRDDLILIYYSGHGKLSATGRLHLASADTRIDTLLTTSISVQDLLTLIDHSRSTKAVLILDCCYSGAVGEDIRFRGNVDDQLQQASLGRGLYVMTGSTGIQTAQEKEIDQYGAFTKHLIEGIREGAADLDGDGLIRIDELYRYVHDQMRGEGAQEPMRWDLDVRGELIIARSGRMPSEEQRTRIREKLYDLARQGVIPDDIVPKALEVIGQIRRILSRPHV